MTRWTKTQKQAIEARGGSLLVSAAAGSGKTAVLVERVISHLCNSQQPIDADRLLIVTFTRNAAAEMKERIGLRLDDLLREQPTNSHIRRQRQLLHRAQISTIDAFCTRLVKEHFYQLRLPAALSILEEGQKRILQQTALSQTLQQCYEEASPGFLALVETFGNDRSDKALEEMVLNVYQYTRAYPFPKRWMQETLALYDDRQTISATPWGQVLLQQTESILSYCIELTNTALQLLEEEPKFLEGYLPMLQEDLSIYQTTQGLCQQNNWDDIASYVNTAVFPRLKTIRGAKGLPNVERAKTLRDLAKKQYSKLSTWFYDTQACQEDLDRHRELLQALFLVVEQFEEQLLAEKLKRHVAEFSDYLHWTLQLLLKEEANTYVPTELARNIASQLDEIIIDEYQDTNEAQEWIFRAISRQNNNLFFVGDSKQSIYGFRQAMPEIFLKKRQTYPVYTTEKPVFPALIQLDQNFRSRSTITDTVNHIFGKLMTMETSGMEYGQGESLKIGAVYPPANDKATELWLLDNGNVDIEEGNDMAQKEGRLIARRVQDMILQGATVTDKGVTRPMQYGDVVVLLRSANRHMDAYVEALQQAGIPAKHDGGGGFFATEEIAVMLSLLRVISNPMQDIPLASVLMSPLYGLTAEDLAKIRMTNRKVSLYLAFKIAAKEDTKLDAILQNFDAWRKVAAVSTAEQFLTYLYDVTAYPALVQAMEEGQRRLDNLRRLLGYAKSMDSSGYHGITGFVSFLDALQEKRGEDLEGAKASETMENVVHVMSIHKSKGLEFPIVVLAGCSRKFNQTPDSAVFSKTLGIGVQLKDSDLPCRYTTLPREAILVDERRITMAEELRVLYVALTRAREKLILIMTESSPAKKLTTLAASWGNTQSHLAFAVENATSITDWILSLALSRPEGDTLRELANVSVPVEAVEGEPWQIHITQPPEASQVFSVAQAETLPVDLELVASIQRQIEFVYPQQAMLAVPTKVTASAMAEAVARSKAGHTFARPAFLQEEKLTAAQRGTATHLFFQCCNFHALAQNIEEEIHRLVSAGLLTAEQGEAINQKQLVQFVQSPLYQRVIHAKKIEREYRFTVPMPAAWFCDTEKTTEETVILQGAIDCFLEEEDGYVLIDYKTDRVVAADELWQRYSLQLALYRYALQCITEKPVKETVLYSLVLGETVTGTLPSLQFAVEHNARANRSNS